MFDRGWRKRHAVAVPVISVGNLTLGGTGKTPCVEHIARFYRRLGRRVALLSRGYGAGTGKNDEALVLEENLAEMPHLQGEDRVALARQALEELNCDVLILDDGFQHRRLQRDLDIVLIDATAPWGYDYLLPRGLLRESPRSLRRADLVMVTRCDLAQPRALEEIQRRVNRLAHNAPVVQTVHRPAAWINSSGTTVALHALTNKKVAAFCGIGNPDAFACTLTNLGTQIIQWRVFPDHHPYTPTDVADLKSWSKQLPPDAAIVTTQKDLVKLRMDNLGSRELWALQVRLDIVRGREVFEERLKGALKREKKVA